MFQGRADSIIFNIDTHRLRYTHKKVCPVQLLLTHTTRDLVCPGGHYSIIECKYLSQMDHAEKWDLQERCHMGSIWPVTAQGRCVCVCVSVCVMFFSTTFERGRTGCHRQSSLISKCLCMQTSLALINATSSAHPSPGAACGEGQMLSQRGDAALCLNTGLLCMPEATFRGLFSQASGYSVSIVSNRLLTEPSLFITLLT